MKNRNKKYFFLGFLPALGLGFIFIFLFSNRVWAANVDISASVGAVCGNGVVEGTEQCDDGNTVSGDGCSSACQVEGSSCSPCSITCSWGACVGGNQAGSCTNCCSSWSTSQACVVVACGNGLIEAGEECDDSNTVSGDGCSATCQLEAGCGNGKVEAGEECDDGNIVSGDCCSTACKTELIINSVTYSATVYTATLNWQTPCQTTDTLLEWGTNVSVSEGSISGLSGQNFSQTISGLAVNTVYYYKLTATAGALQTIDTGSFKTLGGAESCNNGLDDDYNGFCDYPASTCNDGSTPGDPACPCTPDFDCTNGACQANNNWLVTCTDENIPKCQPDYTYEQACQICPGVTCGTCQQLNETDCSCYNNYNCCGNGICEPLGTPPEDPSTCPADCPVTCLSDWDCTSWQPDPCPAAGVQVRTCFDKNACEVPVNPPALQQSCGAQCPGLTCGTCEQIDISQCLCQQLVPCCGDGLCEKGETNQTCPADCIVLCTPNWTCSGWTPCAKGTQTRTCTDLKKCNLNLDKPPEIRSCGGACEVACGTCQVISLQTCGCLQTIPCCGNHICEIGEAVYSCPVDCGLPPEFRFKLPQCLDGLDNDHDGLVDYPADPDCKKPYDKSELGLMENVNRVAKYVQKNVINNPVVQKANTQVAAPIIITAVAVNTVASVSLLNFFSYLRYFFSQPVAALFRRKRRKWGTVYNALTKQPIDLAIVRLYRKEDGKLVQSRVTDKLGRFMFIVAPGLYYLTVTKPKFTFPTTYLAEKKEDVKYLDLYHGETLEVTEKTVALTPNIPLDPPEEITPPKKLIVQHYLRKVQFIVAFTAIPLAVISLALSPSPYTSSLLIFHVLLFIMFRRLGYQRPPKNWGIIYDQDSRKPLGLAIARIYDKQYNKLLETRITDSHGRYSFLVNNNLYLVTAEKPGYNPYKSEVIDLISREREAIVGMDIGLNKEGSASTEVAPPEKIGQPPVEEQESGIKNQESGNKEVVEKINEQRPVESSEPDSQALPVPETSGVSRESLQNLLRAKEGVKEKELAAKPNTSEVSPDKVQIGQDKESSPTAGQGETTKEKKDETSLPEKSIFG